MSNYIKFEGGSCIYCKRGFAGVDKIEKDETGVWHPSCKPKPKEKL